MCRELFKRLLTISLVSLGLSFVVVKILSVGPTVFVVSENMAWEYMWEIF